ncbi:hypothetical protein D910_02651 [Dendroctonus ponderosae]
MIFTFSFVILHTLVAKVFEALRSKSQGECRIIYCSENYIIVDKEPDLKINSNNKNERTLQTFLKSKCPAVAKKKLFHEYYFPHRLDYPTSGIICIPKNEKACRAVAKAFSERDTKKYYIAIVRGIFSADLVDINLPIGDDAREVAIHKMCTDNVVFCRNPRNAQTVITVLDEGIFANYPATKILCRIITGRRHQIRVHCSHLGHTIVGDYTYSNRKDVQPPRMYLHCIRLIVPVTIEKIDVSTSDAFTQVKFWTKEKMVQDLSSAYNTIDQYINSL